MAAGLSIRNFTRRQAPRAPFGKAAEAALPGWSISLAFVGERRARALNRALRGKDYIPNVLSYEAGPKSVEIIICLAVVARQAPAYSLSPAAYCLLLFIHGLLHLKGMRHGATMERRERALLARVAGVSSLVPSSLDSHGPTHRNRHRHRHVPGQAGRGRRGR